MARLPRPARTAGSIALALAVVAGCGQGSGRAAPATSTPRAATTSSTSGTASSAPAAARTTVEPTTVPVNTNGVRPPAPATDPAGLARQIAGAEATLRDATAGERAVAQAGLAQQQAYRQLGGHPEWDSAVLAAVPSALASSVQQQAAARRELEAIGTPPAPGLPTTWQIVAPAPLAELQADYREAGAAFGIPWQDLAAVHLIETATGRIRGTSVAGAQGPMQFLPATWAKYGGGGDIQNTHDAIVGAARYLAANGGAHDMRNALRHYNHNDHYVEAVLLYGALIAQQPLALRAFYHWGVWYRTAGGDVYLPVGYGQAAAAG